ncbi:hypothetical protein [Actinophytocola oryzae]|uniref:Uncharacterized protein n=1 Tax=Actinophytocola oryzae TaxID=502181 RepID=A0A4R7V2V8_9PSEU|nr:hypothetical protein [Actinophytocola oryzae]TDV41786.1 hypothetical protein CLV71_119108 [Actinophytocola oryzae]
MKWSRRSPAEDKSWVSRHPVLAIILLPVVPSVIAALVGLGMEYSWFTGADEAGASPAVEHVPPSATGRPEPDSPSILTQPPSSAASSVVTQPDAPTVTPPPPGVLAQGHVVLDPVDGHDLDTGRQGDQNEAGMDISPSSSGQQINGMTHGRPKMARVSTAEPTGPTLCDSVPDGSWVTPLTGLYEMRVGDRICVRTDQGNYSVLTLRAVPSAGAVQLDVDYVSWAR